MFDGIKPDEGETSPRHNNDGDRVESLLALVETHEGDLKISTWHEVHALSAGTSKTSVELAPAPRQA